MVCHGRLPSRQFVQVARFVLRQSQLESWQIPVDVRCVRAQANIPSGAPRGRHTSSALNRFDAAGCHASASAALKIGLHIAACRAASCSKQTNRLSLLAIFAQIRPHRAFSTHWSCLPYLSTGLLVALCVCEICTEGNVLSVRKTNTYDPYAQPTLILLKYHHTILHTVATSPPESHRC